MNNQEPKVNEFWWAFAPGRDDFEPVRILQVLETGDYKIEVLGSNEFAYALQIGWDLVKRVRPPFNRIHRPRQRRERHAQPSQIS